MTGPKERKTPDSTLKCPMCGAPRVKAKEETGTTVYLRCDLCRYVWMIPERRVKPRVW